MNYDRDESFIRKYLHHFTSLLSSPHVIVVSLVNHLFFSHMYPYPSDPNLDYFIFSPIQPALLHRNYFSIPSDLIWSVRDCKLSNLFLMNYKRSSGYECRNLNYISPKNLPNYSWNELINWLWCRENDIWLSLLHTSEQKSSYWINMLKIVYILAKTATIPSQ